MSDYESEFSLIFSSSSSKSEFWISMQSTDALNPRRFRTIETTPVPEPISRAREHDSGAFRAVNHDRSIESEVKR